MRSPKEIEKIATRMFGKDPDALKAREDIPPTPEEWSES